MNKPHIYSNDDPEVIEKWKRILKNDYKSLKIGNKRLTFHTESVTREKLRMLFSTIFYQHIGFQGTPTHMS